jgi:hypothetical protein
MGRLSFALTRYRACRRHAASLLPGNLQKLETIEQPEFVADFGLHWPACYRIKLRYLANEEQSVHHRRLHLR